ncbi:hypothetical protein MJ579_18530 [Klebsiella pneumoniae]|nr:hypothetical protein MJ579_18530 [Klebsiella pneumoniae]
MSPARDAGLTSTEISAVIKEAMQWQMDFRKPKKGDEFSVLMSREMLDGKREQRQLLGVRLRSGRWAITMLSAPKTANSSTATRDGSGEGLMRFPTASASVPRLL